MAKHDHTPGPWEIRNDFYIRPAVDGAWSLAEVKCSPMIPSDQLDTHKANARLIASAPDLLAALIDLTERASVLAEETLEFDDSPIAPGLIAKARAAINKAMAEVCGD